MLFWAVNYLILLLNAHNVSYYLVMSIWET